MITAPHVENDGITTLNTDIIHLLSQRLLVGDPKYTLLNIARILQRTVPSVNMDPSIGRGQSAQRGKLWEARAKYILVEAEKVKVKSEGKCLQYDNIVLPGTVYGRSLYSKMEEFYSFYLLHNQSVVFKPKVFCALIACIAGTTHGFYDANGRTAIGLADVLYRSLDSRKLDYTKL